MVITATYSPEDNKLRLYASARLDAETYARVKAAGFKWAPKQELFVAPAWSPEREDLALELAGEIGDEDTSLVERAEAKAERLEDLSEKRARDAERESAAVAAIADNIPLGQPILVGHHSEKRARKDAEKIQNGMRRAVANWRASEYWQERAKGALRLAKYKERPDVRARRIAGLESEIRVYRSRFTPSDNSRILQSRWNAGADAEKIPHAWCAPRGGRGGSWVPIEDLPKLAAHYGRWIEHNENRLIYERAMLAESGGLLSDQKAPAVGGGCKCWASPRGGWSYIKKVNKVSVTVEDNWGNGGRNFTRTIPFDDLRAIMTLAEVEAARAAGLLVNTFDGIGFALLDAPAPPPAPAADPAPVASESRADLAATIQAMKETLKAGVQVVAVPQLFPTPVELAGRMADLADIQPGDKVLEPSAGTGRLLGAMGGRMFHWTPERQGEVVAVELNISLANRLHSEFPLTQVISGDFLEQSPEDVGLGLFDVILMNPPFQNGADIKHIQHARKFLAPGGRLVAICANGPRQNEQLQPLADTWEPLPADTFKEQGTSVNTVLLTMALPAAVESPADPAPMARESFALESAGPAGSQQLSLFGGSNG